MNPCIDKFQTLRGLGRGISSLGISLGISLGLAAVFYGTVLATIALKSAIIEF
ncbi:MAG: hypothetical protein ISR51_05730 [Rhodospirillales bacterium]|nr:hypothetical protein [Alphaproteobacteria bacterium]MBL6948157.1 hypothetical protein [Rhodospirillales bacterium]